MEVVLDRRLADRRVWPAIDLQQSGTRKEAAALFDAETLARVTLPRRSSCCAGTQAGGGDGGARRAARQDGLERRIPREGREVPEAVICRVRHADRLQNRFLRAGRHAASGSPPLPGPGRRRGPSYVRGGWRCGSSLLHKLRPRQVVGIPHAFRPHRGEIDRVSRDGIPSPVALHRPYRVPHRWRAFYWNHHHIHSGEIHIPYILTDSGWESERLGLLVRLEDPDKIATILTSLDLSDSFDEPHIRNDGRAIEALKAIPHAMSEQEWWARYRGLFRRATPTEPGDAVDSGRRAGFWKYRVYTRWPGPLSFGVRRRVARRATSDYPRRHGLRADR